MREEIGPGQTVAPRVEELAEGSRRLVGHQTMIAEP